MSAKQRLIELNTRLAEKLKSKGVEASASETTTALINKVESIESGGGVNHSDYINPEWTDWSYFCSRRNSLVNMLKYSDTSKGTNFSNMFYYCLSLEAIPLIDTSNGTDFSGMFKSCRQLKTIPNIDTSNGTNFNSMFYQCQKVTAFPNIDTSKGTNFNNMFYDVSVTSIPPLDTSNGTDFGDMFRGDYFLKTIPKLDISKATRTGSMFLLCESLENITFEGSIPISISFAASPLVLVCAINVITHLVNYAGTTNEFKYTITFSETTWGYLDAEGETASPNGNSWRAYINDLGWNAS